MSIDLSLYKLSDMLQVPLSYTKGKLVGEVVGKLLTSVGLVLPLHVKALKLFSSDQTGAVFHILGDLYVVASHYPKMGGLSLFIVDNAKLIERVQCSNPADLITSSMGLKEVMDALRPGIVGAFHYNKQEWKKLTLPK